MISSVITAVFAVAYLLATVILCRGVKLNARALCLGGVICALTLVLATIRIPLPTGSNITCGSWIPLMLLALVYDYRLAMLTGWVCGILAMILIPGWQAVHWAQIFVQQLRNIVRMKMILSLFTNYRESDCFDEVCRLYISRTALDTSKACKTFINRFRFQKRFDFAVFYHIYELMRMILHLVI